MKIILAITGASGAIYSKQFIDFIKSTKGIDLSVVASKNALRIFRDELEVDLREYWSPICDSHDFDVPFVSGSSPYDAMVILPCSMGTLGRVAHGFSDDVITRAADVCLKERKKLIIVPRETPFNLIHIQNMLLLTQAGATILPAMPNFYSKPKTLEQVADTVVSRVLDHLDIKNDLQERWATLSS